ncbi:MAG: hypothetical protein V4713_16555, partial [Pseudomonadota bacterium]
MTKPLHDLPELLDAINPQADMVQRHLWLIALFDWIRGDCRSVPAAISRIQLLLENARSSLILVLICIGLFLRLESVFWIVVGLPVSVLGA